MKKFLKTRNILIIVILLVVCVILATMRTDISKSKTNKLFSALSSEDTYTLTLSSNNKYGDIYNSYSYSYDENKDELREFYTIKSKLTELGIKSGEFYVTESDHEGNIIPELSNTYIIKDNVMYLLDDMEKEYVIYEPSEINNYSKMLENAYNRNYYSVGYELINGKWLYVEKFNGYNFYFKDNELIYIKEASSKLIYDVKISYDKLDSKLFEVPSNYKNVTEIN